MTIMVDPQDVIVTMRPGMAIYGITFRPGPHADFYVRENTTAIKGFDSPVIAVRPGVFWASDMALIPVMFQIGAHPDQIFETWFNFCATNNDGKRAMEALTVQDTIAFHLYGDSGQRERSLAVNNTLHDFFRAAIEGCAKLPPWPMSAFDAAREELYRTYPTPTALWTKLGNTVINA